MPYEIVMPEDGWGEREVSFNCPLCQRSFVSRSFYLNLDMLLEMGMTQAEFALQIHNNDHHDYDEATDTWS